ncbi:hypothetical protein Hanom_Chr11g01022321 [Helianthus anomalus]
MAWNWLSGNNMTPFSLSESTGDSEEVKSEVHHDHVEEKAAMDETEGVSFRFNNEDEVDDDDDAHSCSYDHSPYYVSTRYVSNCNSQHDQSQRIIYDDGDINDDEDDDDKKSQCQTKGMDSSKQQWRSLKSCVDPLNQREIDKKFWDTCLAS